MAAQKRILAALLAVPAAATAALFAAPVAGAADGCAGTAVFETDGYTAGQSLANWNSSGFNQQPPPDVQIVRVPYEDGVFPVKDHKALDAAVAVGWPRWTARSGNCTRPARECT